MGLCAVDYSRIKLIAIEELNNLPKDSRENRLSFFQFARHGRALTGASPEYARIVGSI